MTKGREIVKVHAEDQDSVKVPVSYAIYPGWLPCDSIVLTNNYTRVNSPRGEAEWAFDPRPLRAKGLPN